LLFKYLIKIYLLSTLLDDPLTSDKGQHLPSQAVPPAGDTPIIIDRFASEPAERIEDFIGRKAELIKKGNFIIIDSFIISHTKRQCK